MLGSPLIGPGSFYLTLMKARHLRVPTNNLKIFPAAAFMQGRIQTLLRSDFTIIVGVSLEASSTKSMVWRSLMQTPLLNVLLEMSQTHIGINYHFRITGPWVNFSSYPNLHLASFPQLSFGNSTEHNLLRTRL